MLTVLQPLDTCVDVRAPGHEALLCLTNKRNVLLTIDRLGNVWGGKRVQYVNTSLDTMKSTAIATLKAGLPVFFGCDVGQFSDTSSGIMDVNLFDYDLLPAWSVVLHSRPPA